MLKNIKQIIATLKSDTAINAILNNKYSIGEPEKIPEGVYCIFKTVSTNDISQVEQKSRVQMILINSDYDTLNDLDKLIKVKIMNSRSLGNFKYHSVRTNGGLEGVSLVKSKTYTRDFIFNYNLNDY